MSAVRFTKKTVLGGFVTGTAFDDTPSSQGLEDSLISRIVIFHGSVIDSIQVYYTPQNDNAARRGGVGGGKSELILDADEIITRVEGSTSREHITQLKLVTNKRAWGPLGYTGAASSFAWGAGDNVPAHLAHRMALLSFSGFASKYVTGLQATFAEFPRRHQSPETLNYEGYTSLTPSALVSKFTNNLMSPTVTLSVGPDSTKFYANKNTLCQLSFFEAALNGGFKEASEMAVQMPEDKPEAVSALIEYLYTGRYTYAYENSATRYRKETQAVPIGNLAEGLFHVSVCAVASKYDAPLLITASRRNFQAVLVDLGSRDKLRLWKAAYSDGFQFPEWNVSEDARGSEKEMRNWVRRLFRDHRQEMETTVREDSQFACDLLRLATSSPA